MSNTFLPEIVPMKWMEWCAVWVIGWVTVAELFITISPYFGFQPVGEQAALSQQNTIIQNVFISIVSFLIGASAGNRKKDDTIQTLTSTAATIATTASSQNPSIVATVTTPDVKVPLHEGQTATVKAEPEHKT